MSSRRVDYHRTSTRRGYCCNKICNDENEDDVCACLPCCTHPNGQRPLILAQTFMFIGVLFSIFVVLDCRFVRILAAPVDAFFATTFPDEFYPQFELRNETNATRGVGFYFFEDPAGKCAYLIYDGASQGEYFDFLGSDWEVGRAMAYWVGLFSFFFWIWLAVSSCVANVRMVRNAGVLLVSVVFVLLQALSLLPLRNSALCSETECKVGSTLGILIGSLTCHLLTGIAMFHMKDYPGAAGRIKRHRERVARMQATGLEMTPISRGLNDAPPEDGNVLNDENPSPDLLSNDFSTDGVGDAREVPVESMYIDAVLGGEETIEKAEARAVIERAE